MVTARDQLLSPEGVVDGLKEAFVVIVASVDA